MTTHPASYSAQHLTRRYGERTVVHDYTVEVEAGQVGVLVGPNGCGKTTGVEMSLGLRRSDGGRALVCGHDAQQDRRAAGRHVGVALQSASLNQRVRVREHLQFFGRLFGSRQQVEVVAARLGLDDTVLATLYGRLSGGQQRRVLTAVALAGDPRVVVLDEPTSGVDVESRLTLWDALRASQEASGSAVLVTTHDLREAEQHADRVFVMRAGRITYDGSPHGYVRASGIAEVVSVRAPHGSLDRSAVELPGVRVLRHGPRELVLAVPDERAVSPVLERLPAGVEVQHRPPTFEDCYLAEHGVEGVEA